MLKDRIKARKRSTQNFINIRNIEGEFLYTKDGYVMSYLKIEPIAIDLFSDNEKESLSRTLTAELSSIDKPFKLLAISRTVDIENLVNEYRREYDKSKSKEQKEIIEEEIKVVKGFVEDEVVERQFFIVMWEKNKRGVESEFKKEMLEVKQKFERNKIRGSILKSKEIIELCKLINNPNNAYNEE